VSDPPGTEDGLDDTTNLMLDGKPGTNPQVDLQDSRRSRLRRHPSGGGSREMAHSGNCATRLRAYHRAAGPPTGTSCRSAANGLLPLVASLGEVFQRSLRSAVRAAGPPT